MKIQLFLMLATLTTLFACQKDDDASCQTGQATLIDVGETHDFSSHVSVTFDSLVSDSRCPCEADCAWAGEATVELTVVVNGAIFKGPFTVGGINPPEPVEQILAGYRVKLLEVLPFPCGLSEPVPAEDYQVKVEVSKK